MTWQELREQFDNAIRDMEPDVEIMGVPYDPIEVWKSVDPTAYQCGLLDYADACGIDTDKMEGE